MRANPAANSIRRALKNRQASLFQLIPEFDYLIIGREREPPRRTGFNEIKERDGPGSMPRNGRNRRGRPRRPAAAFDDMTGGETKDQRF
jgi:hypothetical protein